MNIDKQKLIEIYKNGGRSALISFLLRNDYILFEIDKWGYHFSAPDGSFLDIDKKGKIHISKF